MSKLESSKVFPSVVLIVFVVLVAIGAYFSGSPTAPKMPGVKVISSPVIQAPALQAEEVKNNSETPPSNDSQADSPSDTQTGAPGAPAQAPVNVPAPPTSQPAAPATGGSTSWQ